MKSVCHLMEMKSGETMAVYNSRSKIAEEFINDEKIMQTLAFAKEDAGDLDMMRDTLEKGRK